MKKMVLPLIAAILMFGIADAADIARNGKKTENTTACATIDSKTFYNSNIHPAQPVTSVNVYMLEGSYTLEHFIVEFDNGLIITEDHVNRFGGSMTITALSGNEGNIEQEVFVQNTTIDMDSHFKLIDDQTIETSYNGYSFFLTYSLDDHYLTMTGDHVLGTNYKQVGYWKKISDDQPSNDLPDDPVSENNEDSGGRNSSSGCFIGSSF